MPLRWTIYEVGQNNPEQTQSMEALACSLRPKRIRAVLVNDDDEGEYLIAH